jgi:molybdate transport system substrate-binding protein
MMDRLGITDQMKSKLKPLGTGNLTKAVATGEADFAVWVIPGLIADPGVELAGPVPNELQDYVNLTAGLSTAAKEAEPGKALIKYLTSDAAKVTMKSKGWQPAPY